MDKIENNKTDKSPSRQKTKDPEYDVDWLKGTAAEQASKPIKKFKIAIIPIRFLKSYLKLMEK